MPDTSTERHSEHESRNGFGSDRRDEQRPLGSYVVLGATFTSAYCAMLVAGRRRLPERLAASDLALAALATHRLSRLISRDRVTRPLRAPFTDVQSEAPPLELSEQPRGHGLRRAIGELLTCPYCLDQWIAGLFVGGLAFAPRPTRLTASMFAVVTGSDYLQHLHRWARAQG